MMVTMDGAILHFEPVGELSIYQVEEACKHLAGVLAETKEIRIDLARTDKIDTAGFQLLVSLSKSAAISGKTVVYEGLGGSVENFTALYGYEWDAKSGGES